MDYGSGIGFLRRNDLRKWGLGGGDGSDLRKSTFRIPIPGRLDAVILVTFSKMYGFRSAVNRFAKMKSGTYGVQWLIYRIKCRD